MVWLLHVIEFVLFLDQDLVVEKMVTPDNIMNVVVTLYVYLHHYTRTAYNIDLIENYLTLYKYKKHTTVKIPRSSEARKGNG